MVLDASMAITWLFRSEQTAASHAVLDTVMLTGAVVPALWRLEIVSVLRTSIRRGRCDVSHADQSLRYLEGLSIESDDETYAQSWAGTYRLSSEENLTPYDAAYLELAIRKALPLASCDAALLAAARRRGVPVLTA